MACKGRIKKVVQNGQTRYEKLSCAGTCPDGSQCSWRSSRDHHGATREWCGCEDTEPSTCHIVLYTGPEGEQEVVCAGACEGGSQCELIEERRGSSDGTEVFELRCECRGEGDGRNGGEDGGNGDAKPGCLGVLIPAVLLPGV